MKKELEQIENKQTPNAEQPAKTATSRSSKRPKQRPGKPEYERPGHHRRIREKTQYMESRPNLLNTLNSMNSLENQHSFARDVVKEDIIPFPENNYTNLHHLFSIF